MRVVGLGSGVEIVEDGEQLRIIDRRIAGLYTAGFVFAMLTFIPVAGGIVLALQAMASDASYWPVGLGLVALGCVFGLVLRYIVRRGRTLAAAPVAELPPILIIDLGGGSLLDGDGRRLAPLCEVRFRRKRQLGSSSPALAAVFAGRTLVFARGNPFAGGLGTLEDPLRQRGLMG